MRRIIAHRDYDPLTYDNDIALMELDANVTLNQHIWPICLPSSTYDFPAGREAWITGWGATREGGETRCSNQRLTNNEFTVEKKTKMEVTGAGLHRLKINQQRCCAVTDHLVC